MDSSQQLQILIRSVPMARDNEDNLWGDFDRMLAIDTRVPRDPCHSPASNKTVYFKVCRHTGQLSSITEEQFNRACVASCLSAPESTRNVFTV